VLRHVTVQFAPGPGDPVVDFSLLSDGQQSLLYVSLVLAAHAIGREALSATTSPFDGDRLRPPVFTILAVEESENSLSPHYLGRVLDALECPRFPGHRS
jgi:putative ATP-dependent endonuclease of OLD family